MTTERRHFARVPYNNTARLIANDRNWPTSLIDVSLKGALVKVPDDWRGAPGEHYALEFYLGGSDLLLRMAETVVTHQDQHHLGLRCLSIDLDNMTHLKRLMELNTGDPELIQREIPQLGR